MRETQGGASWRWEGRSTLSLECIDLYDYKSTASLSGMLARIMLTVSTNGCVIIPVAVKGIAIEFQLRKRGALPQHLRQASRPVMPDEIVLETH